jgi:hypothetical protein
MTTSWISTEGLRRPGKRLLAEDAWAALGQIGPALGVLVVVRSPTELLDADRTCLAGSWRGGRRRRRSSAAQRALFLPPAREWLLEAAGAWTERIGVLRHSRSQ